MLTARLMLVTSLLALSVLAGEVRAQPTDAVVVLRTQGRGRPGEILRNVLAGQPAVVMVDSVVHFPRDSIVDRDVLILGGDATVASDVRGDVVVVDGDLFLHPGAVIAGRAVAIGGGVYPSSLARVDSGMHSFRDVTFDVVPSGDGRVYLDWRLISPPLVEHVTWPVIYGFRLPSYTRVDGLGLAWGPRFMIDTGRIIIDPTVTYRSDLGEVDPSLTATLGLGRLTSMEVRAMRGTFTNERWIQSDIANFISTLFAGRDYRNYWRADRLEALLQRRWERGSTMFALEVGGRTERAWSVNAGGPWTVFNRTDSVNGARRPNPLVRSGRITSGLAGARFDWELQEVSITSRLLTESSFDAPDEVQFTQGTLEVLVGFPAFRNHTFSLEAHAVHTLGDTPPPQRFAYVGGSGTLPTFDLLEFGGDRLLFFESRYTIPIERFELPIIGSPAVMLRHMIGMAGVGELPGFEQNIGIRLLLGPLKLDWAIEPVDRDTKLSLGLSLFR